MDLSGKGNIKIKISERILPLDGHVDSNSTLSLGKFVETQVRSCVCDTLGGDLRVPFMLQI